jgi:MFS family permease
LALLLGISQGGTWGWSSPVILGLFGLAIVSAAIWARHEWHQRFPLIDLRLVTRPMVLAADVAALLLGTALYAMSSLVNRYLQTPSAAGYGFDSSLVVVGLVLLPLSVGSLAASRLSGALTRRFGPGKVVATGAVIVGLDMAYLALTRQFIWEFALAVLILGIGIGLSFAMMPALIIRSVPPEETGSATGLNQVLRLVGGSIGSAASIAILASHHQPGLPYPEDAGYTIAFLAGTVICFMAAGVCLVLVRDPGDEPEQAVVLHATPVRGHDDA